MGLILASASPRRKQLLETLGYEFCVVPGAGVDETQELHRGAGELPDWLMRLAQLKGEAVAQRHPQAVVLSADTIVVLDGQVLGKPRDAAEAGEMLARLAGRTHAVLTGVCVQSAARQACWLDYARTSVAFLPLEPLTITRYVELVHPYDYAGGYAIQGMGALLVDYIIGDYSNVVGLPLGLTARLLSQAGIEVW